VNEQISDSRNSYFPFPFSELYDDELVRSLARSRCWPGGRAQPDEAPETHGRHRLAPTCPPHAALMIERGTRTMVSHSLALQWRSPSRAGRACGAVSRVECHPLDTICLLPPWEVPARLIGGLIPIVDAVSIGRRHRYPAGRKCLLCRCDSHLQGLDLQGLGTCRRRRRRRRLKVLPWGVM
jgi:hypothetical protein